MEIEVADQTLKTLDGAVHEFADALQQATNAIEQLQHVWEGNASQRFHEAWTALVADLNSRINNLQPIQAGLMAERNQLVEADQSFKLG
jgi:WXG100 family type VII secretion target